MFEGQPVRPVIDPIIRRYAAEATRASTCPHCGGELPAQYGGEAVKHLTHELEGQGDIKDPKALAASIGRKDLGQAEMTRRSEEGKK
jgi:hypothetical protein